MSTECKDESVMSPACSQVACSLAAEIWNVKKNNTNIQNKINGAR